jgi:hypothetical protein
VRIVIEPFALVCSPVVELDEWEIPIALPCLRVPPFYVLPDPAFSDIDKRLNEAAALLFFI